MKKIKFVRIFIYIYIIIITIEGSLTLYLANDKFSQFMQLANIIGGLIGIIAACVGGSGIADHVKGKKEEG